MRLSKERRRYAPERAILLARGAAAASAGSTRGGTAHAPYQCIATRAVAYNSLFGLRNIAMEAERVNAIANQLADLAQRAAELRRYL